MRSCAPPSRSVRGECEPLVIDSIVLVVDRSQGEKLQLRGYLYITNYRFRFDCDLPDDLVRRALGFARPFVVVEPARFVSVSPSGPETADAQRDMTLPNVPFGHVANIEKIGLFR